MYDRQNLLKARSKRVKCSTATTVTSKRPRPSSSARQATRVFSWCFMLSMITTQVVETVVASRSPQPQTVRGVRRRSYYSVDQQQRQQQRQHRFLDNAKNDPNEMPAFSGDSASYHSRKRTTKESQKSKKMNSSKNKSSKRNSNNIFDHSGQTLLDGGSTSSDTSSSGDDGANNNDLPDKVPVQPVLCAKQEPVQSALLVRMVGEPSLMTRYERLTVEQIVIDSYNDWMAGTCDGYHRIIDTVKLKPIDDLPIVSQVHKETLMLDQGRVQGEEGSEDDQQRQLVQAEDLFVADDIDQDQPTPPPSSPYYDDTAVRYRPLYWLSISGSCRNCPKTDQGNSNLLASRAGRVSPNTFVATEVSASDLILEEVCFCTLRNATANRGSTNGTNMEYTPVDRFFPEAQAPTSVDLLNLINERIQDLQSSGSLLHVEALVQLTEPDYAFYALEMQEGQAPSNTTQDEDTVMSSLLLEQTGDPLPTTGNETNAPTPTTTEVPSTAATARPSVNSEQTTMPVQEGSPSLESPASSGGTEFSHSFLVVAALSLVVSNAIGMMY